MNRILFCFLLIILLVEGSYCIYRLQQNGYGVKNIILPGKEKPLKGLLLLIYYDTELKELKKICYYDKGLTLRIPEDKLPGAEIRSWYFSCRLLGKIKIDKAGKYDFLLRFKDGLVLYWDGLKVADYWENRNWTVKTLNGIELLSGWRNLEICLNSFSYGSGVEIQWRRPGENNFSPITVNELIPEITSRITPVHSDSVFIKD
ncbi:MAG: hypothetical protein N2246_01770 [Candidatus Sumerlaeia bacterium]|nr:hypothetical protein [Candidatus Sumerlaeia bacterium]